MPVDRSPDPGTDPASHPGTYPLTLDAALDRPSRGLWLVKWLLLIPHYVVLAFLAVGLAVTWIAALFAILFTGRYPRPLFDYAVGVLRWGWRVTAYGYGLAGTDRYPPFTLADVPDYPARLDVTYPGQLSRGLVLVKWWLLAIPHYIITGLLYGGLISMTWQGDDARVRSEGPGIIGLLVLVAMIILLIRGSYPQGLFDLIMGLQRWGFRVAAYALLLTDTYPPFRLDLGATEPRAVEARPGGDLLAEPAEPPAPAWPASGPYSPGAPTAPPPAAPAGSAAGLRTPDPWTPGRLVALISGAVLVLFSGGLLIGAASTAVADQVARDDDGYVSSGTTTVSSAGFAVTSLAYDVPGNGPGWTRPSWSVGTLRARVSSDDPGRPLFVGVAHRADLDAYLSGVARTLIRGVEDGVPVSDQVSGTATPALPGEQDFWISRAEGGGPLEVTWSSDESGWMLVVMRADATAGVTATSDVAATLPILGRLSGGLAIAGLVVLLGGAALMILAFRRVPAAGTVTPPAVRA